MWWFIGPIGGGTVFAIVIIALYAVDNPQILRGLADVALVRCDINERLADAMVDVVVNPHDKRTLELLMQGERVLVSNVRGIDDRIKNSVATSIMWDAICYVDDR